MKRLIPDLMNSGFKTLGVIATSHCLIFNFSYLVKYSAVHPQKYNEENTWTPWLEDMNEEE